MRVTIALLAAVVAALAGYLIYVYVLPGGHGTIVVLSDPPGAQVWLDLRATAVTTAGTLPNVSPGRHSVMVKLDTLECDPVAEIVLVRKGRVDTVRFRLLPPTSVAEARGMVRRTEQQPAAKIGEGQTPPGVRGTDDLKMTAAKLDSVYRFNRGTSPGAMESKPPAPPQPRTYEPTQASSSLEVSCSLLGSRIFVNDTEQSQVTPATLSLAPGTYAVRVEREGYRCEPPVDTVRITGGSGPQFVFFDLIESQAAATRQFTVTTSPVPGKIYVDGVLFGEGQAVVAHSFGVHTISFSDVDGYRTPEPVRLTITPDNPSPEVHGVYGKLFRVAAEAQGENKAVADGNIRWSVGVYYEDTGPQPSNALGSKIRKIPGSQRFAWELGVGDPNRNPTGGDYVEFRFQLPDDVPPATPLKLRLYIYRSARRYPFTVGGRSELMASVNGKTFLDGYRPNNGTEEAVNERYEEWSLKGMLQAGENRVLIRCGPQNSLFSYLWKIEIL